MEPMFRAAMAGLIVVTGAIFVSTGIPMAPVEKLMMIGQAAVTAS
jgi:hypothetical protein